MKLLWINNIDPNDKLIAGKPLIYLYKLEFRIESLLNISFKSDESRFKRFWKILKKYKRL